MVNKVFLLGNVGNDPEVLHTQTGYTIAKFSLATNKKYTRKNGEQVDETQWHKVVAIGKSAEIIEKYVKKGDTLYVEGSIKYSKWDDKEGNTRYTTEIEVQQVTLLGSRKGNGGTKEEGKVIGGIKLTPSKNPEQKKERKEVMGEDNLPF